MTKGNHREQCDLQHTILRLLLNRGLKGLTMDLLASELSMSKRTLYELYGSKNELIVHTLDYMFSNLHRMYETIFQSAPDTLTALAEMFHLQGEVLCILTVDFFHDMDTLYPEIREFYKAKHEKSTAQFEALYSRGVKEGVLRPDVNHKVLLEMMGVQMEALKRMEDRFGGQFSLEEIYTTITTGFLRSIASAKGMEILDHYQPSDYRDRFLAFLNDTSCDSRQ